MIGHADWGPAAIGSFEGRAPALLGYRGTRPRWTAARRDVRSRLCYWSNRGEYQLRRLEVIDGLRRVIGGVEDWEVDDPVGYTNAIPQQIGEFRPPTELVHPRVRPAARPPRATAEANPPGR